MSQGPEPQESDGIGAQFFDHCFEAPRLIRSFAINPVPSHLMNKLHLTLAALAVSACCLVAQTGAVNAAEAAVSPDLGQVPVNEDVYMRWTIVGEWRVTHPDWTDILTLHADGSATTAQQGTTAKWTLTAEGGTPLLVLRWDQYGTESLTMVGPHHFRGQIGGHSNIDMRRGKEAPAAPKAE